MPSWCRLTFEIEEAAADALIGRLHECSCLGIETRGNRLEAYFPAELDEADLLTRLRWERDREALGAHLVSFDLVADGRWQERWIESLAPFPIGERFLVIPGTTDIDPGRRLPLRITPSRAFGTGEHATTRLCLQLLEDRAAPGTSVLDVGTGSGILAIAAARLGADPVVAIDSDAEAIETAIVNARSNQVSTITFRVGRIESLHIEPADIVVANLNGTILREEVHRLAPAARRTLILSGIMPGEREGVVESLAAAGVVVAETLQEEDWIALAVDRVP